MHAPDNQSKGASGFTYVDDSRAARIHQPASTSPPTGAE